MFNYLINFVLNTLFWIIKYLQKLIYSSWKEIHGTPKVIIDIPYSMLSSPSWIWKNFGFFNKNCFKKLCQQIMPLNLLWTFFLFMYYNVIITKKPSSYSFVKNVLKFWKIKNHLCLLSLTNLGKCWSFWGDYTTSNMIKTHEIYKTCLKIYV